MLIFNAFVKILICKICCLYDYYYYSIIFLNSNVLKHQTDQTECFS